MAHCRAARDSLLRCCSTPFGLSAACQAGGNFNKIKDRNKAKKTCLTQIVIFPGKTLHASRRALDHNFHFGLLGAFLCQVLPQRGSRHRRRESSARKVSKSRRAYENAALSGLNYSDGLDIYHCLTEKTRVFSGHFFHLILPTKSLGLNVHPQMWGLGS